MSENTPAHLRQRQRIEELCAVTIRALTGKVNLHFRARRLHDGPRMLPRFAPHLHPPHEGNNWTDFGSFRGAADGLALRLEHSDAELHAHFRPSESVEKLLFDLLEQIRVESLVSPWMPGQRRNLRHCFEQWSLAYHHSGLNESARGILLYTTAQTCRSRVSGEPPLELTEDLIETTRAMIVQRISGDLVGLRRQRHDQRVYAVHALNIANTIADLMHSRDDERGDERDDEACDDNNRHSTFNLLFEREDNEDTGFAVVEAHVDHDRIGNESDKSYRIFTSAYDREVDAATLVRRAELAEFRRRLDQQVAAQGTNLGRLARDLKALLAVPTLDGWDGAQEEGVIDGRRLAQLISTPAERHLFRIDRQQPVANCLITFLIDCSGSMRQHIESVAILIDVLVRALEMAGVNSEILGFTTGAWSGGRAQRDWQLVGKPTNPGRLNEICHMVFKDADMSWRRARPNIAALLKVELFREGIDGEAIEWACGRMMSRIEERRMLFVVSDGSPMDSATFRANGQHYLDRHLCDVVLNQEKSGNIDIYGIGVGLDLSPYYRRNHVLDLSAPPGNRIFNELVSMMAENGFRS